MKYCYECGRLTAGEPPFCQFCGRSYDVKLCPRHHPNPRVAQVCSQCGSRELSTPQPKVSIAWRLAAFLARVVLGLLLGLATLAFVLEVLNQFFTKPELQAGLLALAMLIAILWWLWSQLPDWFRRAIHTWMKGRRNGRER